MSPTGKRTCCGVYKVPENSASYVKIWSDDSDSQVTINLSVLERNNAVNFKYEKLSVPLYFFSQTKTENPSPKLCIFPKIHSIF